MIETLLLIGGGYFGASLYHNKKKIKKKKTKKSQSTSQSMIKVNEEEKKVNEEQKQAERYLNANIISLALFAASPVYPVTKLPGLVLAVYSSIPIIQRAALSVFQEKKLKNDLLNFLVIAGTLATGYYVITSLFAFISNLGTIIVLKSQNHSEVMLKDVFEQKVNKVWLLKDDSEIEIPIEDVNINDIVVVHTGELIPIDGLIIKGAATIDQHTLTGESIPVEKTLNDEVFASTLIIAGFVWIKVTQAGQNTVVAKIEHVLQNTSDFKTGLQLKGEMWADKAAIPILAIGIAVLPILGPHASTTIFNSSPGDGIRLTASAQTLTHIILASQKNILIKDGRVLEQLMDVDTVIFDKTGTLTKDEHEVSRIFCASDDYSQQDILFYAAATEHRVSHPLAKAIIEKAKEYQLTLPDVSTSDAKYHLGLGVVASIHGKTIQVGSLSFMEKAHIPLPEGLKQQVQQSIANGFSVVMVAINAQVVGAIEIQAQLRLEIKQVIKSLRQRGLKNLYILSGDHEEPTRQLAHLLEFNGYFHNVSPEEKGHVIEKLQQEGKTVCFIGDGINDVIAMKKANVSISLSGATTIATDVAQVIFMSGTLSELDSLFEISQTLRRRLITTIAVYSSVLFVSLNGILFLSFSPYPTLIIQAMINTTYGISQTIFPLKQLRDEYVRDKQKGLEKHKTMRWAI